MLYSLQLVEADSLARRLAVHQPAVSDSAKERTALGQSFAIMVPDRTTGSRQLLCRKGPRWFSPGLPCSAMSGQDGLRRRGQRLLRTLHPTAL
jgi:hypothetical protein